MFNTLKNHIARVGLNNIIQKLELFSLYNLFHLIQKLLEIGDTESVFSIVNKFFNSSLKGYFDPNLLLVKLVDLELKRQSKLESQNKLFLQKQFVPFAIQITNCRKLINEYETTLQYIKTNGKLHIQENLKLSTIINNAHVKAALFLIVTSLFLRYHFSYLSNLSIFYEKYLARLQHKLPKLKYLGTVGKRLKHLLRSLYNRINIKEIQIGLSPEILKEIYDYSFQKKIFSNVNMPEVIYNKKELIKLQPTLRRVLYPKISNSKMYIKYSPRLITDYSC